MAHNELLDCKDLVIVGYSFPPTDFRSKKLFFEVLSGARPRNVWVVDPCKKVRGFVRRITRHKQLRVSDNLLEFIDKYGEDVRISNRSRD